MKSKILKNHFDFRIYEKPNCQQTKNTCYGRGGLNRKWRDCKQDGGRLEVKECSQPRPQGLLAFQKTLGTRLGVFRVFVELSLEEMLRQQQSKACLYHGRDVFKEMSRSFFHW